MLYLKLLCQYSIHLCKFMYIVINIVRFKIQERINMLKEYASYTCFNSFS